MWIRQLPLYSMDCDCVLCFRYYRGLVIGTLAEPTVYFDTTDLKDFITLIALVQGYIYQVENKKFRYLWNFENSDFIESKWKILEGVLCMFFNFHYLKETLFLFYFWLIVLQTAMVEMAPPQMSPLKWPHKNSPSITWPLSKLSQNIIIFSVFFHI